MIGLGYNWVSSNIKENARKKKPAHDISPVALEAVTKIDAIFDIERQINGLDSTLRLEARQRLSRPLVEDLRDWMQAERDTMSRHNPVAKAIAYMFKTDRWDAFIRFLDDGRICLTNNAAERTLRGVALGRKSWLFAGSERGGERAAFKYSLIVTAKMNDVDPLPMRHVEVPLKIRLDRLHEVIRAAMGWTDTHLYEFRVR